MVLLSWHFTVRSSIRTAQIAMCAVHSIGIPPGA
jgi:hypothetical protein